jgi:hypothetical protein
MEPLLLLLFRIQSSLVMLLHLILEHLQVIQLQEQLSLPHFRRKRFNNTYFIYRSEEAQRYIAGEQDGVYYLTLVNASNAPSVAPFTSEKFLNQSKNFSHKSIVIIQKQTLKKPMFCIFFTDW